MRTVFIKYGPTVQICRNVLLDFVRIFVGSLLGEILSIRTSGEIFDNLLGAPKTSRDWCLVIPGKDRYPEGRVITDHVEELLVTHLLDLDPSEGYAIYSTPETYPAFSSLKDRILERVVHSILPRSHHAIFPMPRVGEAEHLLDLTGVSYRPIQNLESLSRNFRRGVYWVPETRRGVTAVHSVAIVKDTLYIFRITRRSKQTIQFPLLKSIRDALPQKLQSVDKWKFVWVVPYHKSKAFSNPKTVDESGGNTWHQNLQQFVMPADICSDLLRRAHVARLETWPVEKLRLDDSDCR
ncbi:hypothetical protein BD410DRAFT_846553 [Rickenella mellea]|uniref:Uncharacterized protein n=1 Tax=Rickenella mellea TaxID=50990 RepID=A0A4Y7PEN4_9AGAM|nr:hypothetical protein BD410DRAFT_846553 [Rickenella mellea]